LVIVWIALLALLSLSAISAWFPLGAWNGVVNLAIAAIKVILIALVFMELRHDEALPRFALIGAIGFLAILIALSGSDFFTRHVESAPWRALPPWNDTR
jgi:cytochrome c oxidase subunit 4